MNRRGSVTVGAAAIAMFLAAVIIQPPRPALRVQRNWTDDVPASSQVPPPPTVTARAACLVDASTGGELYAWNADEQLPNASTTKILTAIMAIEKGRLDRRITVTKHAADAEPSHIDMKPGEKFTLRDLLFAMMVHSANDAAIAVAEALGPGEKKYMDAENARLKELGCTRTHFVTPNGLHNKEHYTTARDLAKITVYALKNPFFNELIRTHQKKIKRSINQKYLVMRRAHGDRFLFKYSGADGVKTGYTHPAGRCYVGSATHEDDVGKWRLVSVVLHARDTLADTSSLMDYGFQAWRRRQVVNAGDRLAVLGSSEYPEAGLAAERDLVLILKADREHQLQYELVAGGRPPLPRGARVGSLVVRVDNRPVTTIPVRLQAELPASAAVRRFQVARLVLGVFSICAFGCSFGSFTKTHRRRRVVLPPRSRRVGAARSGAGQRPPRGSR